MICKTGFEKHPRIKGGLKRVCNSILAKGSTKRIETMYDNYLKISIKESLRMQRAIEEPSEIMNLNLDSLVPLGSKRFWTSSINKDNPTITTIFFHYRSKKIYKKILHKVVT